MQLAGFPRSQLAHQPALILAGKLALGEPAQTRWIHFQRTAQLGLPVALVLFERLRRLVVGAAVIERFSMPLDEQSRRVQLIVICDRALELTLAERVDNVPGQQFERGQRRVRLLL